MKIRKLLAAAALSVFASSIFASDYYVVVPVPGKTAENSYNKGSLVLSSPLLNFGTRQRGEAGLPLPLELTNVSAVPLTVSGMTIADDGVADGYSVQTDCSVLAPSASCDAYVYYRPIVAGVHVSTLTIANDGTGGSKIVKLQGVSTDPSATLTIDPFGAVNVGSAKDGVAVFTNTGIGNLTVGTPAASGTGFSIVGSDCPSSLSPSDYCSITVRFSAQTTGDQAGVLTVPSGAGAMTAPLTVTGMSSDLQFSSGPLADFGGVAVGSTVTSQTVTLKNSGNAEADDLALAVDGTTGYTIQNSTCGTSLAAGQTCSFTVRFAPANPGAFLGNLDAYVGGAVRASSPLSGVGTSSAISVSPSTGTLYAIVGTTNPVYYTFTNSSKSPVTITSKSMTVSDPSLVYAFTSGTNECPSVVPAQTSCLINVSIQAADSFPTHTQTLTVNTSAGQLTDSRLTVGGSWAKLSPSPANPSFSFGNVAVGASALSTKVTVTNMAIAANTNTVAYSLPDGFSLDSSTCSDTSIRTTSCEFYVKFSPTAAKSYGGNFTMTTYTTPTSGTTGTPQPATLTIPLSGVGTAPAALGWQGGVTDVVELGESSTFTMTLYNPGATAVSLGTVSLAGNTEFQLNSTSCTGSLAANSSCWAQVIFTPSGTGARPAATISVTAGGTPVSSVLSATAGTAVLSPSLTSLAYPATYAPTSGTFNAFSDLKLTIKNTGTAAAENLSSSITYNDATLSFQFQWDGCVTRLNAGASCTTTIRAIGSVVGTHTGTVTFQSASGQLNIPFTFTVAPMNVGVTTVTAVQDTTVGAGSVSKYTVKTDGTAGEVVVQPPTISGNTAEYSLASGSNCNGIIALNSSCTINVLFTPTATGPRPQGTLSINVGGVMRSVTLTGNGLAP